MKTINTQRQFGKRKAFSAILITLVLVGAGLGMTFAAIFTLTDVFESSSSLQSLNLNNGQLRVLGNADTYLTLNVKNIGTEPFILTKAVVLHDVSTLRPGVGESNNFVLDDIATEHSTIVSVDPTVRSQQLIMDAQQAIIVNPSSTPLQITAAEATFGVAQGARNTAIVNLITTQNLGLNVPSGNTISIKGEIINGANPTGMALVKGETFLVQIEGFSGEESIFESTTLRAR